MNEIYAGKVIDGQYIGIPKYVEVSGEYTRQLSWLNKARKHIIVEGTSPTMARKISAQISRKTKALARIVGREGYYISIHSPGGHVGDIPNYTFNNILAELWITSIKPHRIKSALFLKASSYLANWRLIDNPYWKKWNRADCVWREIKKRIALQE